MYTYQIYESDGYLSYKLLIMNSPLLCAMDYILITRTQFVKFYSCSNLCFPTSGCTCGSKRKKILNVARPWRNGNILFCCYNSILLCRESMYVSLSYLILQDVRKARHIRQTAIKIVTYKFTNYTYICLFLHIYQKS